MWALQIPDIDNPVTSFSNLDPLYVLDSPKPLVETLSKSLWTTLIATLATCFETYVSVIWKLIPPQFCKGNCKLDLAKLAGGPKRKG